MTNLIFEKWNDILEHVRKEHEFSDVFCETWLFPLKIHSVEDHSIKIIAPMGDQMITYLNSRLKTPILLKRGIAATIEEWLMSAEYIMSEGNPNVILCERGIRTYETYTRNTLDLSAIPVLRERTHLPVIVDPSHALGISRFVKPMSLASVGAGADGLMIEVHNDPAHALCDGAQSLRPEQFKDVVDSLRGMLPSVDKELD